MKIITLITALLFLFVLVTKAQQGQIKGLLTDSSATRPLADATVALLHSDSTLASTSFTDKKGAFSFPGLTPGNYRVYITFLGYKAVFKSVSVTTDKPVVDMGTVQLKGNGLTLNEVEIIQEVPPIVVKKDTLEFNAGSFKTPVNGVVEDLLKQLPGVEVDAEGNITINGKKVSKITVDGKDFFGSDFKITSKNLPKDIIDKVQIVDNKSREAQFNKTSDGNEDKAINLTLKKGKNKGVFGRASAGYGSDSRYEAAANFNYFSGQQQISFTNNANAFKFFVKPNNGQQVWLSHCKIGVFIIFLAYYFFHRS